MFSDDEFDVVENEFTEFHDIHDLKVYSKYGILASSRDVDVYIRFSPEKKILFIYVSRHQVAHEESDTPSLAKLNSGRKPNEK